MDTVPVLIDAISEQSAVPLVRCIYFHIEMEETLEDWTLRGGGTSIPFLMVGLAGILIASSPNEPRFRSATQLAELIREIESREGHNVETGDIWFPLALLPHSGEMHRGTALRLSREFFLAATRVRAGGGSFEEAFSNISREGMIEISPEETRTFADWSELQVKEFGNWTNRERPPRDFR